MVYPYTITDNRSLQGQKSWLEDRDIELLLNEFNIRNKVTEHIVLSTRLIYLYSTNITRIPRTYSEWLTRRTLHRIVKGRPHNLTEEYLHDIALSIYAYDPLTFMKMQTTVGKHNCEYLYRLQHNAYRGQLLLTDAFHNHTSIDNIITNIEYQIEYTGYNI